MANHENPNELFVQEPDSDSISLTSTLLTEPEDEYEVREVLAEGFQLEDGVSVKYYLVRWEGYPLLRATWEPEDNILNQATFDDWAQKQREIEAGQRPPFDVDQFDKLQAEVQQAKAKRHELRQRKRVRAALNTPSAASTAPNAASNSETTEKIGVARPPIEDHVSAFPLDHDFILDDDDLADDDEYEASDDDDLPLVEHKSPAGRKKLTPKTSKSSTGKRVRRRASSSGSSVIDSPLTTARTKPIHSPMRSGSQGSFDLVMSPESTSGSSKPTSEPTSAAGAPASAVIAPTKEDIMSLKAPSRKAVDPNVEKRPRKANKTIGPQENVEVEATQSASRPIQRARKPSGLTQRPAGATERPARRTDIFANWNKFQPKRTRKVDETALFRNANHRYYANRRNNRDRTPDIASLSFRRVSDGNTDALAEANNESTRVTALQAELPQLDIPDSSHRPTPLNLGNFNPSSVADPKLERLRGDPEIENLKNVYRQRGDVPMTCRAWFESNKCLEHDCRFMHVKTADIAPPNASKELGRPKYGPHPVTCWRWHKDECLNSEKDCDYAHWKTGLVQGPNGGPNFEVKADSWRPKKDRTCFFWQNGGCKYSAEQCDFAHRDCGDAVVKAKTDAEFRRPRKDKKDISCYFWKNLGSCKNGAADCEYAHRDCDEVANAPPGFEFRSGDLWSPAQPGSSAEDQSEARSRPVNSTSEISSRPAHYSDRPTSSQSARAPESLQAPVLGITPIAQSDSSPSDSPPMAQTRDIELEGSSSTANLGMALFRTSVFNDLPPRREPRFEATTYLWMGSRKIGTRSDRVKVYMAVNSDAELFRLNELVISKYEYDICISHFCLAEHVQEYVRPSIILHGTVHPTRPGINVEEIDRYAFHLKTKLGCGLVFHRHFTLLFYPRLTYQWTWLGRRDAADASELGWIAMHPMPRPLKIRDPNPIQDGDRARLLSLMEIGAPESNVEKAFYSLFGVDIGSLFVSQQGKGPLQKNAILFYDEDEHAVDLKTITHVLQKHGVEVYHGEKMGTWDRFVKNCKEGVLIVSGTYVIHSMVATDPVQFHPKVDIVHDLHGLRGLLSMKHGTRHNFFQIGADPCEKLHGEVAYTCERLFPYGTAVLITCDVFAFHPEQCLRILKSFNQEQVDNRPGPRSNRTWKLVTRPGIMAWAMQLVDDNAAEKEANNFTRAEIYAELDKLVPISDQNPKNRPNPAEHAMLVSEPIEEHPTYNESWIKDKEDAADFMVQFFAWWALQHLTTHRRFVVVHTSVKREWMNDFAHIEVVTPRDYLHRFSLYYKPKKPEPSRASTVDPRRRHQAATAPPTVSSRPQHRS